MPAATYDSADKHFTYLAVQLKASDSQTQLTQEAAVERVAKVPGLSVKFGGIVPMTAQVNHAVNKDVARAEIISVPCLLIALVLIFRRFSAAALPLATAAVVAVGSFAVLRVASMATGISTFAINIVTILGLGLAIDYSLLIVNRYRQERAQGVGVDDAIINTVATAGRTVAYSALIVGAGLAGLSIFPSRFLRSTGIAAPTVVILAALGTLLIAPALMSLMRERLDGNLPNARTPLHKQRWYRTATIATAHPWRVIAIVGVVLIVAASPLLTANWARPAEWVLPVSSDARSVTTTLDEHFEADPTKVMTLVYTSSTASRAGDIHDYVSRIERIPHVTSAAITGNYEVSSRITITYDIDAQTPRAATMVHSIRNIPVEAGADTLLTGMPASRIDIVHMVVSRLGLMLAFVFVSTSLFMLLAFRSLVLPLKAALLAAITLGASLGISVLVFQHGIGASLLGFSPVGATDIDFPVMAIALSFGLAMDYEMFVLTRIREARRDHSTKVATAEGIAHTAPMVTAAAVLFVLVVVGFLTSSITFMKMIGFTMALSVLIDAYVTRGLLLPATMAILGDRAW